MAGSGRSPSTRKISLIGVIVSHIIATDGAVASPA
jgi:hypothetical protein